MPFDGYDTGGFYDEMFEADGSPRASARLLFERISSVGDAELRFVSVIPNTFEAVIASWPKVS